MKSLHRFKLILFSAILLTYSQCWGFQNAHLTIHTDNGPQLFQVELAQTEEQQKQGLMFRKAMPQNHGMLFLFDKPASITMWMKNTYIPLDMVFIDKNGIIVDIYKNAKPLSLKHITSQQPALYTLELNAGTTDTYNIKAGDKIELPK